ncbi:hypothetical protein [Geoalkalibacter halelectricus]|uniref:hypothetical protein n=1 Tax=Geoalkalibacter halelectricus TaxID=2847045 RepID=UPI003D1AA973
MASSLPPAQQSPEINWNEIMTGAKRSELAFLAAWKDAIVEGARLCGPRFYQLFGPKNIQTAQSKWDLRPETARVRVAMGVLSRGERIYLGALYSFFNPDDGQQLLSEFAFPGNLADILTRLETRQVKVIMRLVETYPGW